MIRRAFTMRLKPGAMTEYKQALMEAVRANALEIPPDFLPDNAWMLARIQ